MRSEREPDREYAVTVVSHAAWRCTCQDFARRNDWCKHGLAAAFWKRCQEVEPIPFPVPTLNPDEPIPYRLTEKAFRYLDESPRPAA